MRQPQRFAFAMLVMLVSSGLCSAENWPGWRGPRGDGSSLETDLPQKWDGETGENILWKVAIPGKGHASPIVWNNRVFVTSCLEETKDRVLICLDLKGTVLWTRKVFTSPLETKHSLNSFASSTPATDGERVYVSFLQVDGHTIPAPNVGSKRPVTPGKMVTAAYDFAGNRLWTVQPGEFISAHGYCASPVVYKDLVIINGDHDGNSYIVALDKKTGAERWRFKRAHKTRSYATPIIREIDGKVQMVLSGSKSVISLDPADGKTHWRIEGPTEQFVASMVYDGKFFFMAAGFPTHHVIAIRPNGSGDVSETHVAWHSKEAKCYVPSPVLVGDYLFVADDRGTANCFEAATGNRLWQDRMGRHYSASLTTANGLAHFLADDGVVKIVRPNPDKLEVVAENKLGEFCYASPAISQNRFFFRGEKHLFCIGNKK
jgi:outer membrane protein assembly factor BamB